MDWITLLIEITGIVILILWTIIPGREFRQILKRIRTRQSDLNHSEAADRTR